MSSTRRPAAIVAADVAGYSRLMGTDEEGTLERRTASHVLVSRGRPYAAGRPRLPRCGR
jgi:class 3 adenylate cyclase